MINAIKGDIHHWKKFFTEDTEDKDSLKSQWIKDGTVIQFQN